MDDDEETEETKKDDTLESEGLAVWAEKSAKGGNVDVDDVLNEVNVPFIENGIVIDHLPPGASDKVLHILALPTEDSETWFLMNVKSSKMGKKDVVKIRGDRIDPKSVLEKLKNLSFGYTFNIIEKRQVVKKIRKKK